MDDIFCLITKKEKSWQIYIHNKTTDYTFQDDNLQVLCHKVKPIINGSINKVMWYIHFIESSFFKFEKSKKLTLKEQVEKKYNYNIDKIKFINIVSKNKDKTYINVFGINKQAYDEVKEFLKLFGYKLKDEMLFNYKYGLKKNHVEQILLYKCSDFTIAYNYDKLGLHSICNYDGSLSLDLIEEIKLRNANLPITLTTTSKESDDLWKLCTNTIPMEF